MIRIEDLIEIGVLRKPHGTKGEIQMSLTRDFPEDVDYLMLLTDNIPVPFYVEDWRYKSDDTMLLKFEDIESEQAAKRLTGSRVYVEKANYTIMQSDELLLDNLIGYTLIERERGMLGIVNDVDESTINSLLLLESGMVVPVHDDLIVSIDDEKKELIMSLPEGL